MPLVFLPQNNTLLLVRDKCRLVLHWAAAFQFEILKTKFVGLRVVAGRSRTWASRPQAVSRRQMLIHTYHAVLLPCCTVTLRNSFENGMVGSRQEHGMGIARYV